MTEPYKALRVPIAILQQKVYSTAQRLEPWEGIILAPEATKKAITIIRPLPMYGHGNYGAGALPSVYARLEASLFDFLPYQRRYFTYLDGKEQVNCRYCGEIATTTVQRGMHGSCIQVMSRVLWELRETEKCIVCEEDLPGLSERPDDIHSIPLCSENCRDSWDWINPDGFMILLRAAREKSL
jgi:hypothetical protein